MLEGRYCRARRGTLLPSDAQDVRLLTTLLTSGYEALVYICPAVPCLGRPKRLVHCCVRLQLLCSPSSLGSMCRRSAKLSTKRNECREIIRC